MPARNEEGDGARYINILALIVGWAVLVLATLGLAGGGNFVLYYGFDEVVLVTCEGCGESAGPNEPQRPAWEL